MSQGWTLTSRLIRARSEQMRQISSNSLRHIDRPSRSQSAIGGNECFPEIPTYPSHNKRLNPAQFVCSKMAYPIESKWDSAASSFKSCVINVGSHSPRRRDDQPSGRTRREGRKGPSPTPHHDQPRTHTWQIPPCMRHPPSAVVK